MATLTRDVLNRLIDSQQYPCVSIYMPVSPAFPGEIENGPRFENLLRKAERELKVGYRTVQINELVARCREIVGEREFWCTGWRGWACFARRTWP